MATTDHHVSDHGPQSDRYAFVSSLAIGIGFSCLAMLYSLSLFSLFYHHRLHGHDVWFAPGDIWQMVDGGRYVWHGALGYVYRGTASYALPLSFILTAPISAIIDHFHLAESNFFPLARPSAWLVAGPFSLLFGVFVLDAVRRLTWTLGQRRRLWLVQLITVGIVLVPGFEWGHYEDLLALTFVLHSLRYVYTKQFTRAALLLSLAVSSKQWAMMLIPLLVLLSPPGRRIRTAVASCALPVLFVLIVFGTDFRHAAKELFSPVNLGVHAPGHIAFYVTWLGKKTSAVSRALGVAASVLVSWPLRRAKGETQVLATFSFIVILRPFFEAINYSYYWSPGLLLAGLTGVAQYNRFRIRDWIWPAGAIAWTLPHGNPKMESLWWAVLGCLLLLTYIQVGRNCGLDVRLPEALRRRVHSGQTSVEPAVMAVGPSDEPLAADNVG